MLHRQERGRGEHAPLLWTLLLFVVAAACQPPPKQFVGVGDVVSRDVANGHVTIRHDAIVGFAAATTTRFAAEAAALTTDAPVGQRVRFVLRDQGGSVIVTTMAPVEMGNPGIHDHTPHHGGVVGMVGMTHIEARAWRDGRVRVYLTDRFRRPLPLDGVQGTVTVALPDGKRRAPFALGDGMLEASVPSVSGREINAAVALVRDGGSLEMTFQLPLDDTGSGAAGVPTEGCVAPQRAADTGPLCTLSFRRPIGVLAATPDAARLIVAAADVGVSVWRMDTRQFLTGFEVAPAVTLLAPEPPHVEVANAVALSGDGRRAVVALENRLLVHDVESGRILSARPHANGIVSSVAWSPHGDALLVTAFYDPAARLIAAEDGRERRKFPVDREGAAIGYSDDGRMIAVGSEPGPIALFDSATGARLRTLAEPRALTRGVAFIGSGLVAVSDDGALRWWRLDAETPAVELATGVASPLARAPNGERVASAGRDGAIRVYDAGRQKPVAEMRWHEAAITALVWAGETIVSGDAAGHVAFWEVP